MWAGHGALTHGPLEVICQLLHGSPAARSAGTIGQRSQRVMKVSPAAHVCILVAANSQRTSIPCPSPSPTTHTAVDPPLSTHRPSTSVPPANLCRHGAQRGLGVWRGPLGRLIPAHPPDVDVVVIRLGQAALHLQAQAGGQRRAGSAKEVFFQEMGGLLSAQAMQCDCKGKTQSWSHLCAQHPQPTAPQNHAP